MLMLQKQYPDMSEDQLMRHLPAKFESLSGSSKAVSLLLFELFILSEPPSYLCRAWTSSQNTTDEN